MNITYDSEANMAYIRIDKNLKYESTDSFSIENFLPFGMINIDLSTDKKIIGFEISNASKYLSKEFLKSAKQLN